MLALCGVAAIRSRPVSKFALLIPYLENTDISEIVLESGHPPTVNLGGQIVPIARVSLTTEQIEAIVAGTPLAGLVPRTDSEGTPHHVVVEGRSCVVQIARRSGSLEVHIESVPAGTGHEMQRPREERGAAHSAVLATETRRRHLSETPIVRPPPAAGVIEVKATRPHHAPAAAPPLPRRPMVQPPAPAIAPAPEFELVTSPARAVGSVSTAATPGTLVGILADARRRRASDVHIVSDRPVLLRTAGELLPAGDPVSHAKVEGLLMPVLSDRQREVLAERGYVDMGMKSEGAGRLRVNISRQKTGLKGSFRLIMEPLPSLESLGLPADLAKVTTYHQGLVVIAGPSGHGKTTTLAAIVDIINAARPHHIITVEEPVEFIHRPKRGVVTQRDVGVHTKSFATALKASLREDPDVIVIGELRDRETVSIALTAAETGHLVLATMSTPSAAKTIDRLIDLFPPEDQQQVRATLAGALKFVVAQRLLPNVTGDAFVAAVELITGNAPLWALIRDNKLFQLPSLVQRGRSFGMIRFDDSLIELLRAGKITEETALRFADNKKDFLSQARADRTPEAPPPPPAAGLAARARGFFGGKA